jgi:hypothetical protein
MQYQRFVSDSLFNFKMSNCWALMPIHIVDPLFVEPEDGYSFLSRMRGGHQCRVLRYCNDAKTQPSGLEGHCAISACFRQLCSFLLTGNGFLSCGPQHALRRHKCSQATPCTQLHRMAGNESGTVRSECSIFSRSLVLVVLHFREVC